MKYRHLATPIGDLLVAGDDDGLRIIGFPQGKGRIEPEADWVRDDNAFDDVETQLGEYFAGKRKHFELKLAPSGTDFQLAVLDALQQIPYGETCSYSDIATRIGKPKAVRAVGAANGRNPLPIVIPCHRVIGANGSLTGFGGGIDTKRFLLELEQAR
ncbi:MAG: methylated-DNA--[protein]-cysteine S-methyltransferase [Pseudomonadales bacterium]|nr:methylated-DNA--[protein]-cysteine S-methyltransferase [Pseudomonadales bacterium]